MLSCIQVLTMIGVRMMIMLLGLTGPFLHLALGDCVGEVDITIAVPGSLSVPPSEFNVFEDRLIELFNYFQIGPEWINIGLVLYGEKAVNIAYPQPYKTRTQMNSRVTLLAHRDLHHLDLGFENKVSEAIKAVRKQLLFPPPEYGPQILRPGAKKIGVIFTFGPSDDADIAEVKAQAAFAKSKGILLYALSSNGTGPEFQDIGSDYCRLFSMGSFEGLPTAIPDLASGLCSAYTLGISVYVRERFVYQKLLVLHFKVIKFQSIFSSEIDRLAVTLQNCFPKKYFPTFTPSIVHCRVHNNMIQPDPDNCAYFYRCEYVDVAPSRFSCGPATLFDPLTLGCNMLENVACYNDLRCPPGEGGLYPYKLDCSKFINCDTAHVPRVQSCAPGLLFDEVYSTCNATMYVDCVV